MGGGGIRGGGLGGRGGGSGNVNLDGSGIFADSVIERPCAYSDVVASNTASAATIVIVLCMDERKNLFKYFIRQCSRRCGRRRVSTGRMARGGSTCS